jgi:tungstate transport system ATP-binding protein
MNRPHAYQIRELVHRYGEKTVLDIPLLEVSSGQILGLTGANGSGKTTLLSILALLLTPVSGSVRMLGVETARKSYRHLRRNVTLVHQKPVLFSTSVRNNIAFGLRASGLHSNEIKNRIEKIMGDLNLAGFGDQPARELSGGEAQRVVLARALVLRPPIILLDEPTNSLDKGSRPALIASIRKLHQAHNTTFLIATHDLDFLNSLGGRVLQMQEGKILQ